MDYVNLGRTPLRVSRICFGCAGIGGYDYGETDDDTSIAALRRAADQGINFFDVADVYGLGRAESLVQRALGRRAHEVTIATKFGVGWSKDGRTFRDISPNYLRRAVEGSLKRLGVECISLYQIHWPDQKTHWEDCIAALEDCRRAGKLLHIGACNLELGDLEQCQTAGRLESLQLPYSLAEREHDALMGVAVDKFDMTTMAYNVLAHGLFSGKYHRTSEFEGTDLRTRIPLFRGTAFDRALAVLERIKITSVRTGYPCVSVAINWALSKNNVAVAICGAKTATQIEDCISAADWRLTDDEIAFLESPSC
jgi:aryl-alcohol dehydrogenase-like predicted oxidoreductase